MMIRWNRFNSILLTALAAAGVVLFCGCKSGGGKNPKKQLATLRLHLEANRVSNKESQRIPLYREKPVWILVEKVPFLSEANISSAEVINVVGGFALRIQLDRAGATAYEEMTARNHGRRIALFSQFGEQLKDGRWLAAPVVSRTISDGVFIFTPDANREEAEEIALGLNNVSKKVHTWIDR